MPPSPAHGGGRARPAHGRARQRRLAGPHPRLVPASITASWPRGSPGASPASLAGARFPRLAGPRPPPPAWPRLQAARCGGGGWPARRPAHRRARPRRRLAAACRPATARFPLLAAPQQRPHPTNVAAPPGRAQRRRRLAGSPARARPHRRLAVAAGLMPRASRRRLARLAAPACA